MLSLVNFGFGSLQQDSLLILGPMAIFLLDFGIGREEKL